MSGEKKEEKMDRRKYIKYIGAGAAIAAAAAIGYGVSELTKPPPKPTTVVTTVPAPTTIVTTVPTVITVPTPVVTTYSTPSPTSRRITVWWTTMYLAAEQLATIQAVREFEKQTGIGVDITFFTEAGLVEKVTTAVEGKKFPDIVLTHMPFLAANIAVNGLLEDLTSFVNEIKNDLLPPVLEASLQFNKVENKWSYYAIPLLTDAYNVHFWKDLYGRDSAPTDWEEFWASVKEAHNKICKPKGIYGYGLTMSDLQTDGYEAFHAISKSFGFDPFPERKLAIDTPSNRKALIETIEFATSLYRQGLFPPGVITWKNPDNNNAFHSRIIAGTSNHTLSIPAYQYENNKDNYYNEMFTSVWPIGPYGDNRVQLNARHIFIFKDAPNKDLALKFLSFFLTPENYAPYVKGYIGRFVPILKSALEIDKDFWYNPKDPNIPVQVEAVTKRKGAPLLNTLHPVWAKLDADNIFPRAWIKVLTQNITPEQAADELIAQVKKAFEEFYRA